MSTALSAADVFLAAAGFAALFAVAQAVVGAVAARIGAARKRALALEALYTEMQTNTAALERWSFEAAKARRDGAAAAFAPRKAVFGALGEMLHALPKPTLERALDFYAALETLERLTVQSALAKAPTEVGESFWALRPSAETAAKLGRAALFSFEIEGVVAASERPKVVAGPAKAAPSGAPELVLAQAA